MWRLSMRESPRKREQQVQEKQERTGPSENCKCPPGDNMYRVKMGVTKPMAALKGEIQRTSYLFYGEF